jgi:hypothetical protein
VHLVADILDQQVIDANGERAGMADGIVLELRDGRPPRVAYIEVGPITLLRRFSERLARWYARIDARFGEGRGTPFRIAFSSIREKGPELGADIDAAATPIFAVERWLGEKIVCRIPGARS